MCSRMMRSLLLLLLCFCQPFQPEARAWFDNTHITIAEAAGFDIWYSAAAPDVVKSKSQFYPVESPNHYFRNDAGRKVTKAMVLEQADRYDKPDDREGHLYGAIIGSVRDYFSRRSSGRYARYSLIFCAHYVGDLSMPLHNTPMDEFNCTYHTINDGIIESSVRSNIGYMQRKMHPPYIDSEDALAREVAAVAESARRLGLQMRKENRIMTIEEAYEQAVSSVSLMRGILDWVDRQSNEEAVGTNTR